MVRLNNKSCSLLAHNEPCATYYEEAHQGIELGIVVYEYTSHSSNIKSLNYYVFQMLLSFVDLTPELVLKT